MIWASAVGLTLNLFSFAAIAIVLLVVPAAPWWNWLLLLLNVVGAVMNGLSIWVRLPR